MNRRAFSLIEVVVAIGIVAGPLLMAIGSLDSNAKGAKLNASHVGLELLVSDLADQLCTEEAGALTDLTQAEGDLLVARLSAQRIAEVTDDELKDALCREARVLKSLELCTTHVGGARFPRLYRVQVSARSTLGGVVRAVRLVQVPPPRPPHGARP